MKRFGILLLLVAPLVRADDVKLGKGTWDVLVQAKKKWVLRETVGDDKGTITVETYDVRKVGEAQVARLRWTLQHGKGKPTDVGDSDSGRYTQLAVTTAGLYLLSADMDDAKVAAALQKKPSRSDPPKPYEGTARNEGRYLHVEPGPVVCLGQGPKPGDGECEDTCFGEVCISPKDGVVGLSGNWAPDVSMFSAKGYGNN